MKYTNQGEVVIYSVEASPYGTHYGEYKQFTFWTDQIGVSEQLYAQMLGWA
jgi:hypothetical protein